MDQQQTQQQPLGLPPIQVMVSLLALVFLGAMALIFIWNGHNLDIDIGNDNRSMACVKPTASLGDIRDLLGCYRNTTAQSRAKDALRVALGQSCDLLAAFQIDLVVDSGDGQGMHPLTLGEVKTAYALAREIKDADIACTTIPRDPDDRTQERLLVLASLLAECGIIYVFRKRLMVALRYCFERLMY